MLYLLQDEASPAPDDVFQRTADELEYMADYKENTGMQWMSYYGEDGPRAPPVLYMWPAEEVGQVHQVISTHGKW